MTKKLLLCISLLLSGSINTTFAMAPRQRVATLSLTTKKQCVTLFKQHKPLGSHGYKTVTGNYAQRGQRASPLQALSLLSKKSTPTSVVTKPFVTLTKTQEQLLERLKHAARQEDLATMDETFEFIKRKFPALVPQAETMVKSSHLMKDPFSDDVKQKEYVQKTTETIEHIYSNVQKLMFATLFEKRAHATTLSFHPTTQPPTLTWWERFLGEDLQSQPRLFSWIFDPQNMRLHCDSFSFSRQDRSLLFEQWKKYVDTMHTHGFCHEQALKKLQNSIVQWRMKDRSVYNDSMRLLCSSYKKAIEQAMKFHPTLCNTIQDNLGYFDPDEARYSLSATRTVISHANILFNHHKVTLELLLCHFAKEYYRIPLTSTSI